MTAALLFVIILMAVIYIIGICMSIRKSVTHYEWKYLSYTGMHGYQTYYKNATPRNMWRALMWPFRTINFMFWTFLDILHDLIQYPLLIVGIKYKDSNLDRKIRRFLNIRYG
ncbi:MAG: hypothetical protein DRI24_08405 [Deltaproteobacteria bacterium]|nr:MAG: hypothetical protein DRI24_08405 [Deltaproteobacteria bacterium]